MTRIYLLLLCLVSPLFAADCVQINGYHLASSTETEKGLLLAKEGGATVALDLSNSPDLEPFRERIWSTITAYVDILFVGEDEAFALTKLPPKQAAVFLKNFCSVAIVHIGDGGSWVSSKKGLAYTQSDKSEIIRLHSN